MDPPAVPELMSAVAATVARRTAAVHADVYEVIIQEIPELRDDKPVLALLASSVGSNVDTCLQIMQHRIELAAVQAPAAAVEYARRLAQRGTPLTALLRAYRLGHACFSDWLLSELARQTDDAEMISATTLGMSRIVAGYIDQTSEEMVAAYTQERANWLRNRSAARAARIRDLLSGERIDVRAAEATLGYRLRQYHVGLVCWAGDAAGAADEITRLERAISQVAEQAACHVEPVFLPRDESSASAWLAAERHRVAAGVDVDVRSAVQDAGFLLLELGLGQHARRQQLAELLQLGEPVVHVRWRCRGGWWLRRRDRLGVGLLRLGRVRRWRRRGGHARLGLVLRSPPVLLPALDPAVHGAGDRDGSGGLQDAHGDLLVVGFAAGSGRLGRIKGGDDVVGGQSAIGDQPRAVAAPGVH